MTNTLHGERKEVMFLEVYMQNCILLNNMIVKYGGVITFYYDIT